MDDGIRSTAGRRLASAALVATAIAGAVCGALSPVPAAASPVVYSNLQYTGQMATASRPAGTGVAAIESADDFVLSSATSIDHATFIGLLPSAATAASVARIRLEIYRVFPADSNGARTPAVPTRTNSPSDVATASADSAAAQLTFATTLLVPTFVTGNSVQAGGINPSPNQTTGGSGPVSGQVVRFDVDLVAPFVLPGDHYFFVPQVTLANGLQFYWLSASRPIAGPGSTPFVPDFESWIRDDRLAPDWLRIGTDVVGGAPASTFDAAFALNGTPVVAQVPEPGALVLLCAGLAGVALSRRRRAPTAA